MIDYRFKEYREEYFSALYKMNLEYGVMPGLVYLYMPALAKANGWGADEKLWFAFLNGLTQNPITSLRMFQRLSECPPAGAPLKGFEEWFNANWETLQFDTDRRYQKKDTLVAIKAYAKAVEHFGSQEAMLRKDTPYCDLWSRVRGMYSSFGRLSAFSYLEYVNIMGFGNDCDDLIFSDKSGSKSHRNGMLFLIGKDDLVWDKRLDNGQDGNYNNFKMMCGFLAASADVHIEKFKALNPEVPNVGRFTFESNLCTFKNHFFGRRYPGVYADMAQDRIEWADERGLQEHTQVFKGMREALLPEWLRRECSPAKFNVKSAASLFPETGAPYRAEYFL
jgi:hypothetical protein